MKIPFTHFKKYINSDVNINQLSEKLFQLGHEHEINDQIFDMELTPNRGDCLSLKGLLRDINLFYEISDNDKFFDNNIKDSSFKFINDSKDSCKKISFLKIDIDEVPKNYKNSLNEYFNDLDNKKINFFTDVSNYISYETGQPTHCYDFSKINEPISLKFEEEGSTFETLLDKKINIEKGDLVFIDSNQEVINLAGVIGGKNTACNLNTKSVIVECAHFDPEAIIGRQIKYDINSEAAHKFERGVDQNCHDFVLRRFLAIVEDHCGIENVEILSQTFEKNQEKSINYDLEKINKILGTAVDQDKCSNYLEKLGFSIKENKIKIPSFRNDINSLNDISEEVARAIGYDNIKTQPFNIFSSNDQNINFEEKKVRKLLIEEGFFEVINNPFVITNSKESVVVDNPLDSNKKYLRTNLKDSLLENLLFNERRQKDSVKLFEITDLYSNKNRTGKKAIGIIASGRIDKNFKQFSKKINSEYFKNILSRIKNESTIEEISRQSLDSKSKNSIIYCEIEIDSSFSVDYSFDNLSIKDISDKQYIPISEFPSSYRDLSFSIKDFSQCKLLEECILNFDDHLIKERFVFDYFKNEKLNEIKIGFRFIFQSKESTITDQEVDEVMQNIIDSALKYNSVNIPGLMK